MSLLRPHYATKYGYPWRDAIRAEFWWRIEQSPIYLRLHLVNAHARRKAAERRGYAHSPRGWAEATDSRSESE